MCSDERSYWYGDSCVVATVMCVYEMWGDECGVMSMCAVCDLSVEYVS